MSFVVQSAAHAPCSHLEDRRLHLQQNYISYEWEW